MVLGTIGNNRFPRHTLLPGRRILSGDKSLQAGTRQDSLQNQRRQFPPFSENPGSKKRSQAKLPNSSDHERKRKTRLAEAGRNTDTDTQAG